MKKVITVLISLLIAGCLTQPASLPKTWTYSGEDAVTLVAAIGVSTTGEYKNTLPFHFFTVRSEYSPKPLVVNAEADRSFRYSVSDYQTDEGRYGLLKLVVRPGRYYISYMKSFNPGGVTITPNNRIKIPIILEPRKNYYLGTFTVYTTQEKVFLGLSSANGVFWIADTTSPANKEAIHKKFPELTNIELDNYPNNIQQPPYFFSSIEDAMQIIPPSDKKSTYKANSYNPNLAPLPTKKR